MQKELEIFNRLDVYETGLNGNYAINDRIAYLMRLAAKISVNMEAAEHYDGLIRNNVYMDDEATLEESQEYFKKQKEEHEKKIQQYGEELESLLVGIPAMSYKDSMLVNRVREDEGIYR